MKKLSVIIGFGLVLPIFGMNFTHKDNKEFLKAVTAGLEHDKRMIAREKLSHNNAMHKMLQKVSYDFMECGNDLQVFIKKHSLEYRLNEYKKFELDPSVKHSTEKSERVKNRRKLGQLHLQKKQPGYNIFPDKGTRLDFLLANQHYPINDPAFNDYAAMGIYWVILAKGD
jgi:alpha-galactosidase/6-phospho-beta-glucosidase family protein